MFATTKFRPIIFKDNAHTQVKTCHPKSRFSRAKNQKVHCEKRVQQQRAVDRWKQFPKRLSMSNMTWKKGTGICQHV